MMNDMDQHMKLGKRIRGGFNRITIVIIVMMLISIISNMILVSYAKGIYDGPYREMKLIGEIQLEWNDLKRTVYNGIAEDNPIYIKEVVKSFDVLTADLESNIKDLKEIASGADQVPIDDFLLQVQSLYPHLDQIKTYLLNFDENSDNEYVLATEVMRSKGVPIFETATDTLKVMKQNAEQSANDYLHNALMAQVAVISLMVLLLVLTLVVSSLVSKRLEKEILTPVEELVEISSSIAKGDLNVSITYDKNNELGVLAGSMKEIIASLNDLIAEANSLTQGAIEGKLDNRGNAEKFHGGYREIIEGVNHTLDALISPLNMSADYMEQISKGNIPDKITDEYQGDFNGIKNNINTCIDAINKVIADINELVSSAARGELNLRADSSVHGGDFAKIIDGVNHTINTLVGHIDILPSPVMILDKGYNILYLNHKGAELVGKTPSQAIGTKCYDNFKTEHCKTKECACLQAMKQDTMIKREGKANPNGAELQLVHTGIPLKDESHQIVGAMELMTDQTDIMNAMRQAEQNALIAQKQAAYQEREVDQLVINLEKLANGNLDLEICEQESDEDTSVIAENFIKINSYLNRSVAAIQLMIDDAEEMTVSAIEGKLENRADITRHGGSFAKIMEGLNKTLDAVVNPIESALGILKEMEKGNLHVRMEGEYQGGYVEIKDTMNETISNIRSYVTEISSVLSEVADGNLNLAITADYKGDFVEIKNSLNHIIQSLSQVMGDINDAAEQVSTGSKQVSDGSQTLSQGSTQQASSIQELTASMAEVAAQTRQNAVNANEAKELASHAKENAVKGNVQMKDMLTSMDEINESSANISKIIKVIDDIAFQTNILALNAAVEAARAGQHGKGFAVVAEEVRNLAARSAKAARETTELIEGSIQKVEVGTKFANETASALNEIVAGIEKSADLVSGIADASNEQASGIAQINRGIEQVSQVVQNNSATAQQSAAASEELSSQAEILKQMVEKFKLNNGVKALPGGNRQVKRLVEGGMEESGYSGTEDLNILKLDQEFDKY